MSELIKVGDLVMVVRGHLCDVGYVGKVLSIERWPSWHCPVCGAHQFGDFAGATLVRPMSGAPLTWLRRIPDFPELADERHDEEIAA